MPEFSGAMVGAPVQEPVYIHSSEPVECVTQEPIVEGASEMVSAMVVTP